MALLLAPRKSFDILALYKSDYYYYYYYYYKITYYLWLTVVSSYDDYNAHLFVSLNAAMITNSHNDVSVVHGKVCTASSAVISVPPPGVGVGGMGCRTTQGAVIRRSVKPIRNLHVQ